LLGSFPCTIAVRSELRVTQLIISKDHIACEIDISDANLGSLVKLEDDLLEVDPRRTSRMRRDRVLLKGQSLFLSALLEEAKD